MSRIKNIIFDLGGVFIDVDYLKTKSAFEELGIEDFNRYFTQHQAGLLFSGLETGKMSSDEFFDFFRKEVGLHLSDDEIATAWNAMLGDFYPGAVDWLKEVAKKYKIYLFSNTNSIHYKHFQPRFEEAFGKKLDSFFINTYYSHTLQMRKPDVESFESILKAEGLVAEETLFIDDTEINTIAAAKTGMKTIFLQKPQKVVDVIIDA